MGALTTILLLYIAGCCVAFQTSTGTGPNPAGTRSRGSISQKRALRMIPLESADGASFLEALNHASSVMAAAGELDAMRGGAVVEQIPYVPGEVADFDKILLGSAACVGAYAWAAYEFGSRIATQRACEVCEGSGLVTTSRSGKKLPQPVKCYACGGFLPWQSWSRFWQTNMDVGNGGVLKRPASDYDDLNKAAREAKKKPARAAKDD